MSSYSHPGRGSRGGKQRHGALRGGRGNQKRGGGRGVGTQGTSLCSPISRGRGHRGSNRGGRGAVRGGMGVQRGASRGGGPSRGGPSRSNENLETLSFQNLQSMADKDPDALVQDITSEKCLPELENLVSDLRMDEKKVVVVLKVFARACECSTQRSLMKLLILLPKSPYISMHLSSYINRMTIMDLDVQEREDQFRIMIKLFITILTSSPSSYADLPIPHLYLVTSFLNKKGKLNDEKTLSEIKGLSSLKEEMTEKVKQEGGGKSKIMPRRRNPRDEGIKLRIY
ncbi:uncharacterized protein LOC110238619 [Exaiptasia diaphana]|uniref:Uncharacterized protein n=1 Tax=Exaiptasia diaphana TaxID=2652724 RepID=A0A913YJR1_EXADI|nr:uncharacterized protein LOC110238619 [Exaiptasia diaphana]